MEGNGRAALQLTSEATLNASALSPASTTAMGAFPAIEKNLME